MAQLLGFGTGTVNFFGRYAYVGEGKGGLDAVVWTEPDEPQAAIGSHLQKLAYPDNYKKHVEEDHGDLARRPITRKRTTFSICNCAANISTPPTARTALKCSTWRTLTRKAFPNASPPRRFRRSASALTSAPNTPRASRCPARSALIRCARTGRKTRSNPSARFTRGFLSPTAKKDLSWSPSARWWTAIPNNNFLDHEKVIRFNPDGKLTGAMDSFMAGTNLYVVGKNGLFVVGLSNDELAAPTLVGEVSHGLKNPRAVGVQFRYCFVTDDDGFKVLDITEPTKPKLIPGAFVPLKHAQRFYLARTYAYVADGADGLAFIDITNPEKPKLDTALQRGWRIERHARRAGRLRQRLGIRARRRRQKWPARHSVDFAGKCSRRGGLQSGAESKTHRHLSHARTGARRFTRT